MSISKKQIIRAFKERDKLIYLLKEENKLLKEEVELLHNVVNLKDVFHHQLLQNIVFPPSLN